VQLSPDGSKLVYNIRFNSVQKNQGNSDLYVYDYTTHTATPVAADTVTNEVSPRWSADGKTIYYLDDKNGTSQLYSMAPDGSGKKQISRLKNDINEYGISPDEKMIWVTHTVQVEKINGKDLFPDLPKTTGRVYDDLMMRHWDTWKDGSFSHIFVGPFNGSVGEVKDIMSGQAWDSPLKPHGGAEEISWSPDGKLLAYTCKKLHGKDYAMTTNSDIYLYNVSTGKETNLTTFNTGYDRAPLFSPDGKYIAFISWEEPGNEASLQQLYVYELAKNEFRNLTRNWEYNVATLQWSGKSDKIYFIADIRATDQVFVSDLNATD
jgi:Tol biopolymer transport system component